MEIGRSHHETERLDMDPQTGNMGTQGKPQKGGTSENGLVRRPQDVWQKMDR